MILKVSRCRAIRDGCLREQEKVETSFQKWDTDYKAKSIKRGSDFWRKSRGSKAMFTQERFDCDSI